MALLLSLMMLAAIALVAGAVVLWRRGGKRLQVILMLVMAVVIAGNIALWVVPTSSGKAPIDQTLN
jgi:hypothetical protein